MRPHFCPPSYFHESDGGDENSPESSDGNMDDVEAEVDGSFPYNSCNDIVPDAYDAERIF